MDLTKESTKVQKVAEAKTEIGDYLSKMTICFSSFIETQKSKKNIRFKTCLKQPFFCANPVCT